MAAAATRMENTMTELRIGNLIELQDGPFEATWRVVEIIDAGARLEYCGDVRFLGAEDVSFAPNGTQLTANPQQGFLGRAHWQSARRVTAEEEARRRNGPCTGGGEHAFRIHGNPKTKMRFSACVVCGVTEADDDYRAKFGE